MLSVRTFNNDLLPISRFHDGLSLLCQFHFPLFLMQSFTEQYFLLHGIHSHVCTFAPADASQTRWQQSGGKERAARARSLCKHARLCPTLCDPTGCGLPGSSVHGIFGARITACVAMPFSRGSSRRRGLNPVLFRLPTLAPPGKPGERGEFY